MALLFSLLEGSLRDQIASCAAKSALACPGLPRRKLARQTLHQRTPGLTLFDFSTVSAAPLCSAVTTHGMTGGFGEWDVLTVLSGRAPNSSKLFYRTFVMLASASRFVGLQAGNKLRTS